MRELQPLERQHPSFVAPDSPTQREGERLERESKRADHSSQMRSSENAFDEGELRNFDRRNME